MSETNYESKRLKLVNESWQKLKDLDHDKLFTKADIEAIEKKHFYQLATAIALTTIIVTILLLIFHP
jgi:hypothetical protein